MLVGFCHQGKDVALVLFWFGLWWSWKKRVGGGKEDFIVGWICWTASEITLAKGACYKVDVESQVYRGFNFHTL